MSRAANGGRAVLGLALAAAIGLLGWFLLDAAGQAPAVDPAAGRRGEVAANVARRQAPGAAAVPAPGSGAVLVPGVGSPGAGRAEASAPDPAAMEQVALEVEVRDALTDAPLQGARFEVRGEGERPKELRELVDPGTGAAARSGADGLARLLVREGSGAAIQVQREGYRPRLFRPADQVGPAVVALAPAAALSVRARGFEPGKRIDLRVVPTGTRPRRTMAWSTPRTTHGEEVGDDGALAHLFRGLEPGTYAVTATQRRSGFGEAFGIVALPGRTVEVVIDRWSGESVRGQVVDRDSGLPLPGLRVSVAPGPGGASERASREGLARQTTGPAGRFQIDGVPPGSAKVRVRTAEGRHLGTRDIMVVEGNATRELTVRLPAPCTIRGRVEGHAGAGATTQVVAVRRGEAHGFFRDLVRQGSRRNLSRRSHAEVAPDGTFEITDAPAGARSVVIALCEDGRSGARVVETKVAPGGVQEGVIVALEGRPPLRVEVVDASGAPDHSARLRVRESFLGRSEWHRVGGGERSRDGVQLTPVLGRFDMARAEAMTGDGVSERIAQGQGDVTLTLASGARVTVRIEDDQGIALPHARVELRAPRPDVLDRKGRPTWRVLRASGRAVREAFGTAYFSVDPDLPWSLRVTADGYEPHTEAVAFASDGTADHRVVLRWAPRTRTASVVGRLVRIGNGERLYGVRFSGIGKAPFRVRGPEFRIDGLDPGKRTIVVHSRGFESFELPVTSLEPGEVLDVGELRLRAAGSVRVKVTDARGRPLRGSRVRLVALPVERGGREGLPGTIRLQEDRRRPGAGVHRADGVGLGATWRLVVDHRGKRRHRRDVRITGRETVLDVRLKDN